jgi:hypothetical protein
LHMLWLSMCGYFQQNLLCRACLFCRTQISLMNVYCEILALIIRGIVEIFHIRKTQPVCLCIFICVYPKKTCRYPVWFATSCTPPTPFTFIDLPAGLSIPSSSSLIMLMPARLSRSTSIGVKPVIPTVLTW